MLGTKLADGTMIAAAQRVSEMEMALRGPGEFLGTKQAGQSGLSSLQNADMTSEADRATLEEAREAASEAFAAEGEPAIDKAVLMYLKSRPPIPFLDIAPDIYDAFDA